MNQPTHHLLVVDDDARLRDLLLIHADAADPRAIPSRSSNSATLGRANAPTNNASTAVARTVMASAQSPDPPARTTNSSTGAFVVIVYGIVQKYGVDGLAVATMMAGVMLVIAWR